MGRKSANRLAPEPVVRGRRRLLAALGLLPAWRLAAATPALSFPVVEAGRRLIFPADHGAHPDYRTEWWYATGWLSLPDGTSVGFQVTFFRVRTGIGEGSPSAFAPRQLIMAHAALADPRLGRLIHGENAARVGFGRAAFEVGRTGMRLGTWRLEQSDDLYIAEVHAAEFAYALELKADSPPMLNGAAGFSAKGPNPRNASYYYSRPNLSVSGRLKWDGRDEAVVGTAWLDHEWSSEELPEGAHGWDWVGLNLEDGGALMAFRIRGGDGRSLWAGATWRDRNGLTRVVAPAAVVFEPLRQWRSPRTSIVYPVGWRLSVEGRRFELEPLMDDQELDSSQSTGTIYWEGAVRVLESRAGLARQVGRGYLEMTGYGKPIRLG